MTCFNFWYFVMYRNKRKPKYMFCHAIDNDGQVGMVQISTLNFRQRHFKLKKLRCCTIWSNRKSQKGNSHIYKWKWLDALVRHEPHNAMQYHTFSHYYQRSIDFNTVNIHSTEGMYFLVSTGNRGDIEWNDHIIQYTPCSRECTYQYCP